jgi:hypothetical protein
MAPILDNITVSIPATNQLLFSRNPSRLPPTLNNVTVPNVFDPAAVQILSAQVQYSGIPVFWMALSAAGAHIVDLTNLDPALTQAQDDASNDAGLIQIYNDVLRSNPGTTFDLNAFLQFGEKMQLASCRTLH